MSEYESLREEIEAVAASLAAYARAVTLFTEASTVQIKELWADNAELRDELHAVANRLENLTRAVTTAPAETAESMHRQRMNLQEWVKGLHTDD